MHLRSGHVKLLNVLLVALVIVGAGLVVYYVITLNAATPAAITPRQSEIGVGETAAISVSWNGKGGGAPYTVNLYQSPTSSCGVTSTLVTTKTPLSTPGFTFNVDPVSTSYYCGTVTGLTGSSAMSATATVTVSPALTTPSLSLSPTAIDSGQSVTIMATVNWAGGASPYTVTLYSGVNNTCSLDTTKATVLVGLNPVSSLSGTSTTFSVKDPVATKYYCATVTDSATAPRSVTSSAHAFTINQALSAAINPDYPIIDSGQPLTVTAVPAHGAPPYSYQWYTGTGCSSGAQIAGGTSASLTTGPLTSTPEYSVSVTDGSSGTPAASVCASVTGSVSIPFTGSTVVVAPPGVFLDSGQSENLVVSWNSVGTLPYIVTLYTSSASSCQGRVAVGLPRVLSGTTVNFTISPSYTQYYCASVKDGAIVPESSTSAGTLVTVNQAVLPTASLSLSAIDTGQTATLTATVALSGGTAPYMVTLHSGSSATCASDTTVVTVSSGSNPQTGVTGTSTTFSFVAPGSSTYYCAVVKDSATAPVTVTASPVQFLVNPVLSATISPASPSIVTGNSISLAAVVSGGTSPFLYQWYSGNNCGAANATAGQTFQSYRTDVLSSRATYSVRVTDSSTGKPASSFCSTTTVTVTPALQPALILSSQAMDTGESLAVTATVSWTGGTAPYAVTLYSGSSAICSSDTTVVSVSIGSNPKTGATGNSAVFTFAAPPSTTYYCAVVKDSATTPAIVPTLTASFSVNPALGTALVVLSPTVLDSGQSTTITATVSWSGGTAPYTVTLYSGSSAACASDTMVVVVSPGSNPSTVATGVSGSFTFPAPGSNTYYCARVVDAGAPPFTAVSVTSLFTVNPSLSSGTLALSPHVIDTGQSTTVTNSLSWLGGTSPYTVTLYRGSSATCTSDTTTVAVIAGSNPQTGLTGTGASFTFASPSSSTYYCVTVKDSSAIPVTVFSGTSQFTVNTNPIATLYPLSPLVLDSGQSATVTATVAWSGGTSPYTITLFSGLSPSCSSDTTPAGTPETGLTASPTTITFTSPASTSYYCARVTDGSAVSWTYATGTVQFNVNPPPSVAVSPPAPQIDGGQSEVLTAIPSSGVAPYTYQWYTGSGCASAILGGTAPSYATGVLATTSAYSVAVTDSSTGSPSGISTACASVTVTVGNGPEGMATNPTTGMVYVADPGSNHISVIDSLSNSVVTTITVGSLPWGIAVNTATNIVYVTNYGSGTVTVINGTTNAVITTITVGTRPEGIAVNSLLRTAYVANSGSNTVSVINMTSNVLQASVPVGSGPQGIAVGPSPTYTVFVTDYGSNTVSVMDLTYRVTTVTVGSNPWGVAVNPTTNRVYVTNSGSGTVSVINGSTYAVVTTITVGGTPEGIAINPATSRAYVANSGLGVVSVINTATNAVITSSSPPIPIPVDSNPWGVALLPSPANLAYVTNSGSNTVSVINLASNQVIATITVS